MKVEVQAPDGQVTQPRWSEKGFAILGENIIMLFLSVTSHALPFPNHATHKRGKTPKYFKLKKLYPPTLFPSPPLRFSILTLRAAATTATPSLPLPPLPVPLFLDQPRCSVSEPKPRIHIQYKRKPC